MIKRIDDTWTTIQCKALVGDNGEICNLCFKVLNNRFALTQQCPYCLGKIDMRPWLYKEVEQGALKPTKISCAEKKAGSATASTKAGGLLCKED